MDEMRCEEFKVKFKINNLEERILIDKGFIANLQYKAR